MESEEPKSNFRRQYEDLTKNIATAVYMPDKLKKAVKRQQL